MRKLTIAIAGGLLVAVPGPAWAASTGGVPASPAATVAAVKCRTKCADAQTARPGSFIRLTGTSMAAVGSVTFLGGRGGADDRVMAPLRATPTAVVVKVPLGAVSGRLRTRNRDGAPSRPSVATIAIADATDPAAFSAEPAPAPAPPVADSDTSDRLDGHVDANTVFYAGTRQATLRYAVTGQAPLDVAVDVVRVSDGAALRRWTATAVAPGVEQHIDWDGTVDGAVVPEGRYRFRVTALTAGAAQSGDAAQPAVEDSFLFLDHKFPVRGRHDYGGASARFGAGRTGHIHQGQDVLAACGTPLVAARGGVVRFAAFQSKAGNYVVIDGEGTDVDYAYMHLAQPALVRTGDKVATGQRLGDVGRTGDATACHLHFELWTGPGWYEGGSPFDPLPFLTAWDAQSGTVAAPAPAPAR
jgi:murein DD-endopeptidase MepM/ murein hydrolase activator NlpD